MKYKRFFLSAAAAVATTAVLLSSPALAAEQRCNELGANCVCSEPLNTTTLIYAEAWYNPGDSTTKQCTIEGFSDPALTGSGVRRLTNDLIGSNDSTVLGRLPKRTATLQYFLRGPEGGIGAFDIGHMQTAGTSRTQVASRAPGTFQFGARTEYVSTARMAARVYTYFSNNFTWTGGNSGQCTNGKRAEIDTMTITHGFEPTVNISAYNFNWGLDCASFGQPGNCGAFKLNGVGGTQLANDCCNNGPNNGEAQPTPAEYQGKWWLFEWVISNRVGPGWRLEMWGRNVTDNLPERKLIDSNGSVGSGGGPWIPSAQLTPNEINTVRAFDMGTYSYGYRAGVCPGWNGFSHFLMAQWDTNTGQRIGPAYEMEGGTPQPGDTTPPGPPSGLRISAIWDQFLKVFWTMQ